MQTLGNVVDYMKCMFMPSAPSKSPDLRALTQREVAYCPTAVERDQGKINVINGSNDIYFLWRPTDLPVFEPFPTPRPSFTAPPDELQLFLFSFKYFDKVSFQVCEMRLPDLGTCNDRLGRNVCVPAESRPKEAS